MRVYQYSDHLMSRRVQERFERYGVKTDVKDARQVEAEDIAVRGRIDPFVDNKAAETYLKAEDEEPVHLRVHRARDETPRRHPRPQGGPPRLRGLRLRPRRARVPAGGGGGAPRQRRPLLHRHARARRHARLLQRPVRGADRREERPRRDRRHDPGVRGRGEPGPRHRRFHRRQDERPRDGHRPHRPGVEQLLPARLRAGHHPPRRPLPEDRGARAPARGDRARPPGLLRPLRRRRRRRGEGHEPHGPPDPVRARRSHAARRDPPPPDHLRARADEPGPGEGPGRGRRRRLPGRVHRDRGAAAGRSRHARGGRPPGDRGRLPQRPEGRPRAQARPGGEPELVHDRAGVRASRRRLPGQAGRARRHEQAHGHGEPRVRGAAPRRAPDLEPDPHRHRPGRPGGRPECGHPGPRARSTWASRSSAASTSTGPRPTRPRACLASGPGTSCGAPTAAW